MTRIYPAVSAREAEAMDTSALRAHFLVDGLFRPGEIAIALTEWDRVAIGSAVPAAEPLLLPNVADFGTAYFLERRELGVLNLGGPGVVRVDGVCHALDRLDCLYVGKGARSVEFEGSEARFYFASSPSHAQHPTAKLSQPKGETIGTPARASLRTIRKYVHPEGIRSSQLMMGFTETAGGNIWNTMPPHTHSRRMEIYLYFDLGDEIVVHLMGKPDNTRHLVVRNCEAVISPPWSIHMGAGTGSYRFAWVMAGENQDFGDMDQAPLSVLR